VQGREVGKADNNDGAYRNGIAPLGGRNNNTLDRATFLVRRASRAVSKRRMTDYP
jgi:hypothetical protein